MVKKRQVFDCERLTGALLDRFIHRIHIIEANGPSYRLRQSKKRLKGTKDTDPNSHDDPVDQDEEEHSTTPE